MNQTDINTRIFIARMQAHEDRVKSDAEMFNRWGETYRLIGEMKRKAEAKQDTRLKLMIIGIAVFFVADAFS